MIFNFLHKQFVAKDIWLAKLSKKRKLAVEWNLQHYETLSSE